MYKVYKKGNSYCVKIKNTVLSLSYHSWVCDEYGSIDIYSSRQAAERMGELLTSKLDV